MMKEQQDQLRLEYEGKLANLEREREGIGEWVVFVLHRIVRVQRHVCVSYCLYL